MSPSLFLTCFGIYVIAVTCFGAWMARKKQTGEDFLLGGRSLPFFLTLGTTVATMVGTGSSMGSVGKAYSSGWMGSLFGLGGFIGIVLLAWLFAPARKFRFMTMAEELSCYVGGSKTVSRIVAVFTYLACVGWLGAHILGGGYYLQYVTGINGALAMVFVALGFAVYSTIGGYRAVVWTDSVQAVVLFFGFVVTAIFALKFAGGFEGLSKINEVLHGGKPVAVLPSISLVVAIAVGVLATPAFRQRIYSGRSVSDIRKAFYGSGILVLGFAILPSIIGMAAYLHNSRLEKPDLAFPYMATEMLPLFLGVLTLLAGLSATMSSASSDAIAGVTTLVRDIYEMVMKEVPSAERVVLVSRAALVTTTCLALGMALMANDIMSYIKDMIALFITGMCVCGVLGKLWPRYNAPGAVASLVGAFVTALVFRFNGEWSEYWGGSVIPALVVSSTLGIVVSKFTRPDEISLEEAAEDAEIDRNAMEESSDSARLEKGSGNQPD